MCICVEQLLFVRSKMLCIVNIVSTYRTSIEIFQSHLFLLMSKVRVLLSFVSYTG